MNSLTAKGISRFQTGEHFTIVFAIETSGIWISRNCFLLDSEAIAIIKCRSTKSSHRGWNGQGASEPTTQLELIQRCGEGERSYLGQGHPTIEEIRGVTSLRSFADLEIGRQ